MNVNALLQQFSEQQVAGFMLVIAPHRAAVPLAPMFSSKMIPARVRGIVAVGLAVGIAPLAMKGQHVPLDVMGLGALAVKELLVGLAFAFSISVLFAAVTAAGSLMDTLIGFSFGALIDPITGNNASVLSQVYSLVGVAVFIAIDGDAWVIQGLEPHLRPRAARRLPGARLDGRRASSTRSPGSSSRRSSSPRRS